MASTVSGVWSAVLSNGSTVYQSGNTSLDGPITIVGTFPSGGGRIIPSELYVMSGAVVSGLTTTLSATGAWTSVYVNQGGKVTGANLSNTVTHVENGASITSSFLNDSLQMISSGGSAANIHQTSGITNVYSGAYLNDYDVTSHGNLVASNGASVTNINVASTGSAAITTSGNTYPNSSVSGVTVQNGGHATISNLGDKGQFTSAPVLNGPTTKVSGVWSAVLSNGSTVYQSGNTSLDGPITIVGTFPSGGGRIIPSELYVMSGAVVSGLTTTLSATGAWTSVYVNQGGKVTGASLNNAVTYVGNGASITDSFLYGSLEVVSSGGTESGIQKHGGITYASSGAQLTDIYLGSYASAVISNGAKTDNIQIAPTGNLDTYAMGEVCFLAGSLITTPNGDVAVENLEVGHLVTTFCPLTREFSAREIVWCGKLNVRVDTSLSDDLAGYSIKIQKGAFGPDTPNRDLFVTAEHCFFFDGKFIPARMLVNGANVVYNYESMEYECYHIETEKHSIILANNTLTESYLDTGNRSTFGVSSSRISIPMQNRTWIDDAAAPLETSRSFVEPIHRKILDRCRSDKEHKSNHITSTDNYLFPIHVITDSGSLLSKRHSDEKNISFLLPSGTKWIKIISDSGRPSDLIGPFVDDRRKLGALIGKISIFHSMGTSIIDTHLTRLDLSGWEYDMLGTCRWTKGDGYIPMEGHIFADPTVLSIEVHDAMCRVRA